VLVVQLEIGGLLAHLDCHFPWSLSTATVTRA
jgi:hypothetical protein